MPTFVHPDEALFSGEQSYPSLPVCEHFSGSEKLIRKALQLQEKLGGVFDITCDCEDGAQTGNEIAHAEMIAELVSGVSNPGYRIGVRIHDVTHSSWRSDVNIIVGRAADYLAYVTIPKSTNVASARECIDAIQEVACAAGRSTPLPVHILIETHAALRHVYEFAELPHVKVVDFGLMDFVSSHHGAIGAEVLRSPGQFNHHLLSRAKADVVAAALAAGVVPAHNVCLFQSIRDATIAVPAFMPVIDLANARLHSRVLVASLLCLDLVIEGATRQFSNTQQNGQSMTWPQFLH